MMGLVSPCQVIDRLCCRKKWIFNISWLLIHKLDWLKGKENSGTLEKVQWGCWLEKCGISFFSEQGLLFCMTVRNWVASFSITVGRAGSWTWVSHYVLSKWQSRYDVKRVPSSFLSENSSRGWETSHTTAAGNLPFRDFCFQLMMVSHKTTEKRVFGSSVPEVMIGEDRQYMYAMDTSQTRKSIIPSSSEKLYFPQSLELEAAHPGINNVVKNWCNVEFSEA